MKNLFPLMSAGFAMQVLNILFMLGTTALLAISFGVADFGKYVIIVASTQLLSIFTTFGLPTFLTREIAFALEKGNTASARATLRFALLTAGALLAITLLILAPLLALANSPLSTGAVWGAGLFLCAKTLSEIFAGALLGYGKLFKGQFIPLILLNGPFLLFTSLAFGVFHIEPTLATALQLQALGVAVAALFGLVWLLSAMHKAPTHSPISWANWIKACLPLVLINGLAALQQNLILLVLGLAATPEAAGIFRIAERIGAISQMLNQAINRIISLKTAQLWAAGHKAHIASLLRQVCRLNTVFNLTFLLGCLFLGKWVILTAFGPDYLSAWLPLVILATGFLSTAPLGFNGLLLTMSAHPNRVSNILFFTVPLQLGLVFFVAEGWGAVGAACVSATTLLLREILIWRAAKKATGIDISLLSHKTPPHEI